MNHEYINKKLDEWLCNRPDAFSDKFNQIEKMLKDCYTQGVLDEHNREKHH